MERLNSRSRYSAHKPLAKAVRKPSPVTSSAQEQKPVPRTSVEALHPRVEQLLQDTASRLAPPARTPPSAPSVFALADLLLPGRARLLKTSLREKKRLRRAPPRTPRCSAQPPPSTRTAPNLGVSLFARRLPRTYYRSGRSGRGRFPFDKLRSPIRNGLTFAAEEFVEPDPQPVDRRASPRRPTILPRLTACTSAVQRSSVPTEDVGGMLSWLDQARRARGRRARMVTRRQQPAGCALRQPGRRGRARDSSRAQAAEAGMPFVAMIVHPPANEPAPLPRRPPPGVRARQAESRMRRVTWLRLSTFHCSTCCYSSDASVGIDSEVVGRAQRRRNGLETSCASTSTERVGRTRFSEGVESSLRGASAWRWAAAAGRRPGPRRG